jgi:hypothetical protein
MHVPVKVLVKVLRKRNAHGTGLLLDRYILIGEDSS